ncbi:MAG: outer membrane beta-barrel protein [Planctomycetes bacterium]|nr:outer membrane beta-barrel protein [Planctomycetota bacterium]
MSLLLAATLASALAAQESQALRAAGSPRHDSKAQARLELGGRIEAPAPLSPLLGRDRRLAAEEHLAAAEPGAPEAEACRPERLRPFARELAAEPAAAPLRRDRSANEALFAPPVRKDSDLAYDYVDARIVFGDLTGLAIEGSYRFDENWFGTAHVLYGNDSPTSFTTLSAGAGYRLPLQVGGRPLDVVFTAELEYARLTVEVGPFEVSDSEVGLRLRAGGRYRLDEQWELRAGLGLRTVFDTEFIVDLAGQYNLNDRWGLIAQLDLGSEFTLFGIGARLSF